MFPALSYCDKSQGKKRVTGMSLISCLKLNHAKAGWSNNLTVLFSFSGDMAEETRTLRFHGQVTWQTQVTEEHSENNNLETFLRKSEMMAASFV